MPQYGQTNAPENLPAWSAAARGNIGQHPFPLTARIDASHYLKQDAKMRPLANRWAIEFRHLQIMPDLWCPLSTSTPPLELTLTISGVQYVGPGSAPPEFATLANGTFTLVRSATQGGCVWEHIQTSGDFTIHHLAYFPSFTYQGQFARWGYVFLSMVRRALPQDAKSFHPFIHGPVPEDQDGRFDVVGAFPLSLSPQSNYDDGFPEWDYGLATVTCDILTSGTDPVVGPDDLINVNRFWCDIQPPLDPTLALTYETGTSADGFSVHISLFRSPLLPISQSEGWLWFGVVRKDDVVVALVETEQPDTTAPMQYDETLEIPTKQGTFRTGDESYLQDGGYFVGIAATPYPENFAHFNVLERSPSLHDENQTGLVSIAVTLEGWKFEKGLGVLEAFTMEQSLFELYINQTHILQPVYTADGWAIDQLVKICRTYYDRDAKVFIGDLPDLDNIDGMRYDMALVLRIVANALTVQIHFRASGYHKGNPWETIPDREQTWNWHLHEKGLGSLYEADGSNGGGWNPLAVPFKSRDIGGMTANPDVATQTNDLGAPSFPITPGTVSLASIPSADYGTDPPLQGPLNMAFSPRFSVLIQSDGVARSVNDESPMVFQSPISHVGDWWDSQNPSDIVVPNGVSEIKVMAQGVITQGTLSGSYRIKNLTNPWPIEILEVATAPRTSNTKSHIPATPPLPVFPGDIIHFTGRSTGETWGSDALQNWLYAESVERRREAINLQIAGFDEPAPLASDRDFVWVVPTEFDRITLVDLELSYGNLKSLTGINQVDLRVIRASSRNDNGLLLTPVTIDQDHWSSRTSVIPHVIDPAQAKLFAGDIVYWQQLTSQLDSEGLMLALTLEV